MTRDEERAHRWLTGRRDLLKGAAGLGFGALMTRWMESTAHAAPAAPAGPVKSVILLWMNGGPSHLDTWDPKQGKAAGSARAIKTKNSALLVSEHLPRMAALADRLAVVRGTSREGNHQRAQYLLRTGYAPTPTVIHPTLAAWTSKRLGEPSSGLPASVSLGGPSLGAGFFGVQHGPFVVEVPGQMPQNVGYGPAVDATRFAGRMDLLGAMEGRFAARTGDGKVDGRAGVYQKADRLMHAQALRAFDVSEEPERVRQAFGDTGFGRGCLTALRLVGAGVRFAEVTLDGWDTHEDVAGRTKRLMGILDPAMSALLAELEARDLARSTLLVWMGEFGRTPKLNARDGRDHHPAAWSAVLAGAGVRGGVVHGETDADGSKVVKDAVSVPDLLATVATLVGLSPDDTVQSPAGRPIALTDHGAAVRAIMT